MSELFDIPETLSPRLKWMRKNSMVTAFVDDKWLAEVAHYRNGILIFLDREKGDTEDESIVALAKKLAIPLWNEPTRPL
jgi:hypothetical protein